MEKQYGHDFHKKKFKKRVFRYTDPNIFGHVTGNAHNFFLAYSDHWKSIQRTCIELNIYGWLLRLWCGKHLFVFCRNYSQSKSSVHDKLHELLLHFHFPPIPQRTSLIITSSCWKSTVSDLTPSCIDWKKRWFRTSQVRLPSQSEMNKNEFRITGNYNL